MPQVKAITLSPTASDPDGIAQTQTPAAGGEQSLTINGALASGGSVTLSQPQHVTITSVGNDSGRTFTVTGTNRYGDAMTEAITGANAGVAQGSKNFATVTGITTDANTAAAVTAGVDGTAESQWYILNYRGGDFSVGIGCVISSGGAMTYTVQHTFDSDLSEGVAATFDHSDLAAKTASDDGSYTSPPKAIRFAITAYTSGTLTGNIIQARVDT